MFKLILADIKVLGHRIWAIPLGVFLFIMMFSFIPYLNQVQKFQSWIFAILIPGLLTYELFREKQKSGTDKMLMTMPVSKEKYVWSKYVLIVLFIILSLLIGSFTILIIEQLGYVAIDSYNSKYFSSMIYPVAVISGISFFMIPIYLYTKRIRASFLLAPIGFFGVKYLYIILSQYFEYRFMYSYTLSFVSYHINIMLLILGILFIHSIIIYKLKKLRPHVKSIWFVVIIFIFVLSADILKDHIYSNSYYYRMKEYSIVKGYKANTTNLDERPWDSKDAYYRSYYKRYARRYSERQEFMFMFSLSAITILGMILMILYKESQNRFVDFISIFCFMPIIIQLFEGFIKLFLGYFMKGFNSYYPLDGGYPLYLFSLIFGTILYMIYSAKSSIYLLKNNRTLK